jgi:hypothetical protein
MEAIHGAYRRLARLYHPDLNPRPEAAERMRAINAAYRVLSDPRQRAAYDARRYLRPIATTTRATQRPRPRPVVILRNEAPTELQKRVDRIVAVVGILLIVLIGIYAALVIPRAEQQFQEELRGVRLPPTAASTISSAPPRTVGASVVERVRSDNGLRQFPGTVLVPPATLAPFKDLPILRVESTGQGIARYAVYYGDLTTGVATISGLIGRASFDAAVPHLSDCASDAPYCAGPNAGQAASDSPGLELFRGPDLAADYPAFASHRVCCNGLSWSFSWYEPSTNMSYTIDLSRSVAAQFGGTGANHDRNAARAVADLARQLVRLPG